MTARKRHLTLADWGRRIAAPMFEQYHKRQSQMTTKPTATEVAWPDFLRQPGPVTITFASAIDSDCERYIQRIYTLFDQYSGDNITREGNTLRIYPRAVND